MSDNASRLRDQIRQEREEERRNVEEMRVWIKRHEEAQRPLWKLLFNRAEIGHALKKMKHFAAVANRHQARANELESELRALERA